MAPGISGIVLLPFDGFTQAGRLTFVHAAA
jgi:hypothetical protein